MGQMGLREPLLTEPPIYLTCSIISSSDFPLTHAGEALRKTLTGFVNERIKKTQRPGAEWIGPPSISSSRSGPA